MTSGVYRIRNRATGFIYIGSTFDIRKRIMAHLCALRAHRHQNRKMQADWIAFGKDGFAFSILEAGAPDDIVLSQSEDRWINRMRSYGVPLYNRRTARIGRHLGSGMNNSCRCQRCSARRRAGSGRGTPAAEEGTHAL